MEIFFAEMMFRLTREVLDNPLWMYLVLGIGFMVRLRFVRFLKGWTVTMLESEYSDQWYTFKKRLAQIIHRIPRWIYFFVYLLLPLTILNFSAFPVSLVGTCLIIIGVWRLTSIIRPLLIEFLDIVVDGESYDETLIVALTLIIQSVLWILCVLLLVIVWGGELTPLFASLGVGGIVLAFAIQQMLKDVFSSFSLFFDKPFRVGDMIIIANQTGKVEHISLKSTRIKMLSGYQLIVPNSEMVAASITNLSGTAKRRVVYTVYIDPFVSHDLLLGWQESVRVFFAERDDIQFGRMHCHEIGLHGMITELMYWTIAKSFDEHMDSKQEVLFAFLESAKTQGIIFRLSSLGVDDSDQE